MVCLGVSTSLMRLQTHLPGGRDKMGPGKGCTSKTDPCDSGRANSTKALLVQRGEHVRGLL